LSKIFNHTIARTLSSLSLIALFAATWDAAGAQALPGSSPAPLDRPGYQATEARMLLPDAPDAKGLRGSSPESSSSASAMADPPSTSRAEAPKIEVVIQPGEVAPKLTSGDKVLLGLKDSVSPFAMIGWIATAGYEQATDGSPDYGSDRGAFGQRLGAAAIRDVTDDILSESLMAPVFHEDPRYYRMGKTRNFFVRVIYSGTRPLITRTDSGSLSPNFANLSGTLEGSAITNLYYPQVNRGFGQTLETFGGSIAGDAVGDLVTEFYRDFTAIFRSEHK
jgi:hypothetical protein